MSSTQSGTVDGNGKLKRKEYERELARLHVEFVKLQQWVEIWLIFLAAPPAANGQPIGGRIIRRPSRQRS
jgi:hypothetical protein